MPTHPAARVEPLPQDLHMHTVWSDGDDAVHPAQTVALVSEVRHARVAGISDHFELLGDRFEDYAKEVRAHGFRCGTEVGSPKVQAAASNAPVDYYVMHCEDKPAFYTMAERFLETGKPVIIAHPMLFDTDLEKVPPQCYVEVNNRYVWRNNWRERLAPYAARFNWVISSDAHQPHWLNQTVARYVAAELGIVETLLFSPREVFHEG